MEHTDEKVVKDQFLEAMRNFGASVCIIAANHPELGKQAMTASSVISVTLEPPTMALCINKKASIANIFTAAPSVVFSINLLQYGQQDIATLCATTAETDNRFAHSAWVTSPDGIPVIQGAAATMICSLADCVSIGSHIMVIGTVTRAVVDEAKSEPNPLLYCNGQYGQIT